MCRPASTNDLLQRTPSWQGAEQRLRPKRAVNSQSSVKKAEPLPEKPKTDISTAQQQGRRGSVSLIVPKQRLRRGSYTPGVSVPLGGRLPPVTRPSSAPKKRPRSSGKVKIPRSLFELVKSIFDEYDKDGDGAITEEEFIAAVARSDAKAAEREAIRVKGKYFDEGIADTMAMQAERRRLMGEQARRKHASAMFHSVMASKPPGSEPVISVLDFMCMYFTHLERAVVKKACLKYAPPVVTQRPHKPCLEDVQLEHGCTAKEEASEMFKALDSNGDGFVGVQSLKSRANQLGITEQEIDKWVRDLPPVMTRAKGGLLEGGEMCRMKSKLDLKDWECMLGPIYCPSPKKVSKADIMRDIERSQEMSLEAIYVR